MWDPRIQSAAPACRDGVVDDVNSLVLTIPLASTTATTSTRARRAWDPGIDPGAEMPLALTALMMDPVAPLIVLAFAMAIPVPMAMMSSLLMMTSPLNQAPSVCLICGLIGLLELFLMPLSRRL